eukprot:TRINITY_DN9944_c2_g1_i2.p2 TRINITY_DN9944_c2_g1~~TRINITY_DN9944_c2_g1_i2.p2  ORF type:complete len:151 (-),score=10.23 TRINITY_DN9944_c2_g1_i2:57-509(-)
MWGFGFGFGFPAQTKQNAKHAFHSFRLSLVVFPPVLFFFFFFFFLVRVSVLNDSQGEGEGDSGYLTICLYITQEEENCGGTTPPLPLLPPHPLTPHQTTRTPFHQSGWLARGASDRTGCEKKKKNKQTIPPKPNNTAESKRRRRRRRGGL